jgi:hypothetical protein
MGRRGLIALGALALSVGAGAGLLLASSRDRSLDPELSRSPGPRAASATPAVAPSTRRSVVGATPAPRAPAPSGAARVPAADQNGRLRVPLADLVPTRLPAFGAPAGWGVAAFAGTEPAVELVRLEGRLAVRLRSQRNSFALHRDLSVDLGRYPVLSWSWRVSRLPAGGDVRVPGHDDQAAGVYVVFPRWPSPRTSSDVIGYVWDTQAPVGTRLTHPRAPNARIIVVESGPERLDRWLRQQRNVAEDYRALFGRQPPLVGKLGLMIDSNDTRSEAEALFGELAFAPPGIASHTEIPTTMLR